MNFQYFRSYILIFFIHWLHAILLQLNYSNIWNYLRVITNYEGIRLYWHTHTHTVEPHRVRREHLIFNTVKKPHQICLVAVTTASTYHNLRGVRVTKRDVCKRSSTRRQRPYTFRSCLSANRRWRTAVSRLMTRKVAPLPREISRSNASSSAAKRGEEGWGGSALAAVHLRQEIGPSLLYRISRNSIFARLISRVTV